MTRGKVFVALIGALLLAVVAWRLLALSHKPGQGGDFGQNAVYALNLPDVDGKNHSVAQWRGKVLVLNFWATWCGPCRKEMPALGSLAQKYAGQGVQFLGVSIDEPEKVRAFQSKMNIFYPLLIAEEKVLSLTVTLGNVQMGLPFTMVLDQEGKIAKAQLGVVDENVLDGLLMTLISQAETRPAR